MKRRQFLVSAAASSFLPPALHSKAQKKSPISMLERDPAGWVDIAPGPNLEGWTEYPWFDNFGDDWRHVKQWHMDRTTGILLCDGAKQGHSMFLHNREYADFIYHVEWRFSPRPGNYSGYNSGVLVRMLPETPTRKVMYQIETGSHPGHAGWLRGGSLENGELTVMNTRMFVAAHWQRVDPGFPRGWKPHVKTIAKRSDPAGLKGAYDVGIGAPVHPPGEWNYYEIVCRKHTIRVWTNGFPSSAANNVRIPKGRVGLEAEWHRIEFRNLKLKVLP